METFEYYMSLESNYRELEFAAVKAGDYHAAQFFHSLRWKCMDAAVKVVEIR